MKTYKFLMMLLVVVSFASCGDDFLEPVPTAVLVGDTFPTNESDLESVLTTVYDALQGVNSLEITNNNLNHGQQIEFYVTEMLSDNTRSKSGEGEAGQFDNFTVQPTNGFVFDYYRSMYSVITRANLVLENIDLAITDGDRIEGEARFMRALAYFNLVRSFGDVPLIDGPISIEDVETQFTRVPTSEIYSFIVADLQSAASKLGSTTTANRASKAAAQGILAKVYLTQRSNYGEAQSLLEEIIASQEYALESDFREVFYNEANGENIFTVGYVASSSLDSQNFSAEMLNGVGRTSGVNYVTDEAIAALDEFGGDRAQYSKRVDAGQPTQTQVVKYLPNGDASLGIEPTSSDPTSAGNDWIILRYSDVLLMHVEAILAGGAVTQSSNALESFQEVRNRAGLTDIVEEVTSEQLLIERRVELAFENHRIHDLKRFGTAQQVLTDFSNANGHSFSATDLLLPLPQFEVNLSNGLLTQNPGY
ncbi:putative outer membrane starch-binding protein [Dokdonia sp. Hel_I_63]|uniref:RagB/SusD family nutrient uptake outer membrane protein n=1 Tax=unclassified Dokdonia TaxID=2615033 RepID=UPI00020A609E|nr:MULTISPECIES: RagB/SusD family nutrient uptake outer membrane protein [unclassified Dokdonia]AEE18298.1 RagB/SusD domain protein [Dokdonia sp. 4H-3-7-5]TVZ22469.1 putative outer membrane starch-binding protein [Dokdonia sp. Hel_I_63]